jgi:hypothetical protein
LLSSADDPLTSPPASPRKPTSWPYAFYGVLSLFFCAPLFTHPQGLGILDWDQHLFYYASVLKSVVEYGQLPFWNPWYCGGNVLWQNPQIPLLSPVFPLTAVVSLPLAMKINIALHYWMGLAGMHLLLTSGIGLTFAPAVAFLSSVAILSGGMAMHLAVGHSVFLPCFYLPLQLYFCIQAMRTGSVRHMALGGVLLALMVYNGALHVVPMSVAAVGLLALFAALARRDWRPVGAGALLVVLGFAYSAPKLVPVALWVSSDQFVDARTVLERPDRMTLEMLVRTYVDRYQTRAIKYAGQRSGWYEYGNYIGGTAAVLLVASLVWTLVTRIGRDRWLGIALSLTSICMLALSAGEFSPWAPASLANHVPLFSSFRIPSRYTIAFVMCAVPALGWALRELGSGWTPSAQMRRFLAIAYFVVAADVLIQNREQLAGSFSQAPLTRASFALLGGVKAIEVDAASSPYGPGSPMLQAVMSNRSFFNCYESLQTKRVATPDGRLLATEGDARIVESTFSPSRIEFSVIGGRGASEVALNQNLAPGWRSSAGPVVPSRERGQPAVRIATGQTGRFEFTFVPPGLFVGIGILLVAVCSSGLMWRARLPGRPAA